MYIKNTMKLSITTKDILLLLAAASIIILWNTWTGSLTSWDEAFYAQVSREVLSSGNWMDLSWKGSAWSDKPPLYMWATALFFRTFGINEFSARLFSGLSGIGSVLLVYLFGKKLYSRKAGIASSLILLSTWSFLWASKTAMLDGTLTFFIMLSVFLFKCGEKNNLFLFFSPIAFALAFFTKGSAALLIPIILFIYIVCSKNYKLLIKPQLLFGVLASLAVLFWWHWTAFSHYGKEFTQGYFIEHLLKRTTTAMDSHTGDWLTYTGVIPNKGRPWSMLGFALIPYLVWRVFKNKETEHLLPIIWASVVLVIFSAVKTKLYWYIMPIYPALALMSGWAISKVFKKYTVPVVAVLSIASIAYLGLDKDVFNLDYAPDKKIVAQEVKEVMKGTAGENAKIYLYDISDPGMFFYLGDIGVDLKGADFERVAKQKGNYIFVNSRGLKKFSAYPHSLIQKKDDYSLIKTGK